MKVNADININSTKERVWAIITDIENSANIISGIRNIEILNTAEGDLVGLKWKETRVMFGNEADEVMWITDSEKYKYYQTRAENSGLIYLSKLIITEEDNGVNLAMSFEGYASSRLGKIVSTIMGLFMKRSMKKAIEIDLMDIKKESEKIES